MTRSLGLATKAVVAAWTCALVGACTGPPVPSAVKDDPICPDFEVGATRTAMRGGLKQPVSVAVLDGKDVVMRTTVLGRRTDHDTPARILLPDGDAEYEVQWAQCENERAPQLATAPAPPPKSKSTAAARTVPAAEYECGNSTVYKTEKLTTKKGDLASHALTFPPPPKPECWTAGTNAASNEAGATDKTPPGAALAPDELNVADAGADSGGPSDAGPSDAGKSADASAVVAAGDAGPPKKKKPPPSPTSAP